MNKLKSGIYKITINDYYIYIGQSANIERRRNSHLNKLKQNIHCNKKIQNIYNKYPTTIKFEVIEYCDVDKLNEREAFYIQQLNTFNTKHGLNMDLGGFGHHKYKTQEEAEVATLKRYKDYYNTHIEKIREYSKQYRKTHEKELKEYCEQRYINNKEKIKEKCKQWCYNNMKKVSEIHKQYRKTHEKELKEYSKQWYRNNKKRILIKQKEHRRQKGILSHFERRKLQFETRYNCSRPLTDEEWNTWMTDKSISGNRNRFYAIKFLKTLPNITFTLPPKK